MSLLTKIKLKENFGRLKTNDRKINGVGSIVLEPRIYDDDPYAKVTLERDACDGK